MIPEQQAVLDSLKERITNIISLYESTKKDKNDLAQECAELKKENQSLKVQNEELKEKYNNINLAKAVSHGDSIDAEAKDKLNNIVREIDKCIALLNK